MDTGPLLVFYVAAGGGHRSAANAIAEAARARGREVEVVDALSLAPRWFSGLYTGTFFFGAQHTPTLYGTTFARTNRPDPTRDRLRDALDRALNRQLVAFVKQRRPSAVISTHFAPLVALGRMRRSGDLDAPVAAVVTDYVTHALWCVSGVDLYCTAPGRAALDLCKHGARDARLVPTGIPIRSAFGDAARWRAPARGQRLNVLVTVGGFGLGPVIDVLRGFRGVREMSLDVVCGDRPALVDEARNFVSRNGLDAIVTGFADDMPRRVSNAHVVIGKPGGLTVSECLAAGRPMVLVGACPGQELGNQHLLSHHGAAIGCEARDAGRHIERLVATDKLARMARRAARLGIPDAATRVLDAVERLGESTERALDGTLS